MNTKIYQDPLCKQLGYSVFDLIDLKQFTLKYYLKYFEINNNSEDNKLIDIKSEMEGGGTRTIINGYNKNKPNFDIYFGQINDDVFDSFVNKHLELAGKKTKTDNCWELNKKVILEKKAILLFSGNNYILYYISNNYSCYATNACTKKDRIVTYLLYEGINWLTKKNYKLIHFGTFPKYVEGEKNINISKFKKAFCNKMFTQYYLEL